MDKSNQRSSNQYENRCRNKSTSSERSRSRSKREKSDLPTKKIELKFYFSFLIYI